MPAARLVRMGRNVGFAAGCNAGAAEARGDLLVILNPDAAPRPGWGEAIRRPWLEGRGWAAWQALVAEAGGSEINSAGNPVHFTGIVWAGRHGEPIGEAPPPSEVVSMSGACMAIPLRTWREVGGFEERFFLYHEDVDLSLRLRLRGDALGIEPSAVVDHDYEFGAREHKWRWLERNRLAILVRVYPARLLLLLIPGPGGDRARPARRLRRPRLGRAEARRQPGSAALAAAPARRAAADPARPRRRQRRVRRLADPRPRLPVHPPAGPLAARQGSSCAATGGWSPRCSARAEAAL